MRCDSNEPPILTQVHRVTGGKHSAQHFKLVVQLSDMEHLACILMLKHANLLLTDWKSFNSLLNLRVHVADACVLSARVNLKAER